MRPAFPYAPASVTRGHAPQKPRALLPRRGQAALPAAACSNSTGASYRDPLFELPDLVEEDYYRFRNQPRGW